MSEDNRCFGGCQNQMNCCNKCQSNMMKPIKAECECKYNMNMPMMMPMGQCNMGGCGSNMMMPGINMMN